MTRDLKVLRDPWRPKLLTDIRDFTTLFYLILRRKSSEWVESSIESDLGMPVAIWSVDLAIRDFAFFKQCFQCKNRSLKSILPVYFRDSGKQNFYIRDLWSSISSVCEPCQRPPCATLKIDFYHWQTTIAKSKILNLFKNLSKFAISMSEVKSWCSINLAVLNFYGYIWKCR